uniref:Uncharacterized protein n=1 Tax=Meloidogyne enterolobii TaxID=390850 RepID=A0A6V7XH36_MELEN|nr:unnamed protein product [Meloidogyne enterolobii]
MDLGTRNRRSLVSDAVMAGAEYKNHIVSDYFLETFDNTQRMN